MTDSYRFIHPWERASDYAGADLRGWYTVYSQTRDEGIGVQVNYRLIYEKLRKLNTEIEDGDGELVDSVTDARFGHWACGWYETILIHRSNTKALDLAEQIMRGVDQYPLVDDIATSEEQWAQAQEQWESMSIRERCELMRDELGYWIERGTVSLFAARRDELPEDPQGSLLEALAPL